MPITKLRANAQVLSGSVDSTVVRDNSLITRDFAVFPGMASPMTTAKRDALVSPEQGTMVFNTDTGTLDVYYGTQWVSFLPASTITQWDGGAPDSIYQGDAIDGGAPDTTPETYGSSPVDGGTLS